MKRKKFFLKLNQYANGYTLVEVVLVMAFVSLTFMSLYGIFAETIQGDTESRNEIIASNLAQECIERIRNCRDEKVLENPAGWDISSLEVDCLRANNIGIITSGVTSFLTIASVGNGSDASSRVVTCKTSWESFLENSLNRKVEIKSLLSNWQKQR